MKEKQGNNKRAAGLSKNPVVNAFQQAWIWFKETAWIQVILVVIVVFGVVFSIPFIVRAATAESDDDAENIDYIKGYRVDYDQLQKEIKDTSRKYTVVFYYSPSDSNCSTLGGYLKDYILNSDYFQMDDFKDALVTFDLSRTDDEDENDYDITADQVEDLANIYKPVYNSKVWNYGNGPTYSFGGNNRLPLYNSSYSKGWDDAGNSDGTLSIPADTWVIYENSADADLSSAEPVWISLGWNTLSSGLQDFLHEFEASINYAVDPDLLTLKPTVDNI